MYWSGDLFYTLERGKMNFYFKFKRIFDIMICVCTLPVILPIVCLFSIFIVLENPGNPIFTQERVGKKGKVFRIYKLRSMVTDAERIGGHQWAKKKDNRVTKVGAFIRRTRIDELPQVINILKGEMSLIGPRPERPEFVEEFLKDIPDFNDRLEVNPGITGWAQVNGGYELSPQEKLAYDKYYIQHESLSLDMIILFKTVRVILTGEGAR